MAPAPAPELLGAAAPPDESWIDRLQCTELSPASALGTDPPTYYGGSVVIDESIVAIGGGPCLYVFEHLDGDWLELDGICEDGSTQDAIVEVHHERLAVLPRSDRAGHIKIYERGGARTFQLVQDLSQDDLPDESGPSRGWWEIALTQERLFARAQRHLDIFERGEEGFVHTVTIEGEFAPGIDALGERVAVAAVDPEDEGKQLVRLYQLDAGTWTATHEAPRAEGNRRAGDSVALSAEHLLVGAQLYRIDADALTPIHWLGPRRRRELYDAGTATYPVALTDDYAIVYPNLLRWRGDEPVVVSELFPTSDLDISDDFMVTGHDGYFDGEPGWQGEPRVHVCVNP